MKSPLPCAFLFAVLSAGVPMFAQFSAANDIEALTVLTLRS
jgi:hypothetical protein